ncbi:MAG: glycosyltransferase family 61 protein [Actinomycetota bacterium]|nr:glycosyltransferase family 61 protein [Actinomycetota bacterium]MDQ3350448.1 glycosyltransferase family 61 protein [Actinomycetota bacterium]
MIFATRHAVEHSNVKRTASRRKIDHSPPVTTESATEPGVRQPELALCRRDQPDLQMVTSRLVERPGRGDPVHRAGSDLELSSVEQQLIDRLDDVARWAWPRGDCVGDVGSLTAIDVVPGQAPGQPFVPARLFDVEPSSVRRVVLFGDRRPVRLARALRTWFPSAAVEVLVRSPLGERPSARMPEDVVVHVCDGLRGYFARLAAGNAPEVVVDATGGRPGAAVQRFRRLFHALAPDGRWVTTGAPGSTEATEALWAALDELADVDVGEDDADDDFEDGRSPDDKRAERYARHLARSVADRRRDGVAVIVRKRGSHVVKVHEDEVGAVVRGRIDGERTQVLRAIPASRFRSRATATANTERRRQLLDDEFSVPELLLRESRDVVCAPGQLALLDDVVLPASFHHPAVVRLRTRPLADASAWFSVAPSWPQSPAPLDGPFFLLDSEFPVHFGHVYTEDLAKLWAWDEALARHPDLRLLRSADGGEPPSWLLETLRAFGISSDRVVCIDAPVRVELLLTASQMFHNGAVRFVHPDLAGIWSRLRHGLRSGRPSPHERIFVTRTDERRVCTNRHLVEATFADHGFTIVRPETLPLPDQVELFASASVVAGLSGSGMFGLIHSPPGVRIVIGPETYTASNEYLISAVTGGEHHHFEGPAIPPAPWEPSSTFHRDFSFDFARDGQALAQLLERL